MMSNKAVIALYVLPALALIFILIYVPIVLTGYYGLMRWDGIGQMTYVGLAQYHKLIHDSMYWRSAYHSLQLAVFSVLSLAGYLLVSLVLSSKIRGTNFFRKVYLVPMLLSSVAIAQLWVRIYHPTNGVLNNLLISLGVDNPPLWLSDTSIVLYAIFAAILWQYAGFYILIYYAALSNVPAELIEAARIDGAKPLQIAFRVKIPIISGVIKVTIVLALIGSLKYFDLIYIMTDGGPHGASEVIASYMYRQAFRISDFGYSSAIGFSLLLMCLVLTWIIRKLTAPKDSEVQY